MLFGIDHLALSAPSLQWAGDVLSPLGYELAFSEPSLVNAPAKRPLLRQHADSHDIGYFRHTAGGPAVEATVHGPVAEGGAAPYRLVLRAPVSGGAAHALASAALGEPVWEIAPAGAAMPLLVMAGSGWAPVAVTAEVADPDAEAAFWQAMGLRPKARAEDGAWHVLELASPMAALRLTLVLLRGAGRPEATLDVPGFPCLAFLSRLRDGTMAEVAARGGRDVTTPFSLAVNGRALTIALFRSPGGLLCELIQPASQQGN